MRFIQYTHAIIFVGWGLLMGYEQLLLGNTIGVVWLAFLLVSFAYLFIRSFKGLTPEVTLWTKLVSYALMASAILVFRN